VPSFAGAGVVAAWLVAVQAAVTTPQPEPPALQFESIDSRPADEARVRRLDRGQLRGIVQLVGLHAPGPPIHVVLAPEDSEIARATPPWIAGLARGATGTIVLFPSRSPYYPHDSIEAVLRHEVAHVLIARAAGHQSVPRWFDEGLAVVAERAWQFEDRWQLAWASVSADRPRLEQVNALFGSGSQVAGGAYALASAFVRHIIDTHGAEAPARILAGVADGLPFDVAFARATGRSLAEIERSFDAGMTSWTRRLSFLTSPLVLWMMVTLLALAAIYVSRRRTAERRSRWADEDARAAVQPEEGWTGETPSPSVRGLPRDRVH
jgi:hypothetical protein